MFELFLTLFQIMLFLGVITIVYETFFSLLWKFVCYIESKGHSINLYDLTKAMVESHERIKNNSF